MKIDNYVQSGERIYCQTTATKERGSTGGDLLCTDYRLLYLKNDSALDIDLRSIEEIKIEKDSVNQEAITWGGVALLGGIISWFLIPEIQILPADLRVLTVVLGAVIFAITLATYLRPRTQTLTITTRQNEREFRGDGLSDFPHAIRGAGNQAEQ